MALIEWIQYTERATGQNHPTREDVVNRPLRQLLANSGISPDADGIAILTGLNGYTKTEVDSLLAAKSDLASRTTVIVTTASLDDLETEDGEVALGQSFELYKVVVDRHCRVRLYQTAAARTADAARPIGTDPETAAGVIADLVFTALSGLTIICQPRIPGENHDGPVTSTIYYAITNMSGGTQTVQATFTRVITEP
jgi:hypothetical protein